MCVCESVCVSGGEVLFPERGDEMRDEWEGQRRAVCLCVLCSWIDESQCGLRLYLTGWLTACLHIILWLTVLTCSNTSLNRGGRGEVEAGCESYRSPHVVVTVPPKPWIFQCFCVKKHQLKCFYLLQQWLMKTWCLLHSLALVFLHYDWCMTWLKDRAVAEMMNDDEEISSSSTEK